MPTESTMPSEAFAPQPRMPKPLDFKPEEVFPPGHRWEGQPRCRAWSARNGRQCNKVPMKNKTVCRSHGGAGGRPPSNGKYSGPARVQAAYHRVAGKAKDFDLRPEIALVVIRIQEHLDNLGKLEGAVDHAAVAKAIESLRHGVASSDLEEVEAGWALLTAAVDTSEAERNLWREIREDMEQERRLVDAERRWLLKNGQMVPVEEALEFANQILLVICKHVPDPVARAAIAGEISAMLPKAKPPPVNATTFNNPVRKQTRSGGSARDEANRTI